MTKTARRQPHKARQESRRRDSTAQAKRNPMLQVRVPQSLYKSLKSAAEADSRTLADWLRLNLPRLLLTHVVEFPITQADAQRIIDIEDSRTANRFIQKPLQAWVPCERCGEPEYAHTLPSSRIGHAFLPITPDAAQSADAVDPHASSTGTPTPRGLHLGPTFVDDLRIDK